MHFKVGVKTDIGRKRTQNQDSCASHPDLGLFVVSDGMGGHKGGETASITAVEVISAKVRQAQKNSSWNAAEVITQAICAANLTIFQEATKQPQLQGMGTTTTALLFRGDQLTIGHVGDSRCYFIRSNALWQATRDHSLVQEKLRAGLISRKDVRTDRMKNVITRSVGFERDVSVEIYTMQIHPQDCFLLCSDGLSGLIEDSQMLEIVQKRAFGQSNLQEATEELVQAANQNGGDDNITTILVQVCE